MEARSPGQDLCYGSEVSRSAKVEQRGRTQSAARWFAAGMAACLVLGILGGAAWQQEAKGDSKDGKLRLGNFSVSLVVKDLAASKAFYEKLGFKICGGVEAQKWLVMQNETSTIGLFQGMIKKNMLTYNPGWDRSKQTLPEFDDVRDIQKELKSRGVKLLKEADETKTGPAYVMLEDPDGNQIGIDQHVDRPTK